MAPTIKTVAVIGAGHVGGPHAVMLAKKCPKIRVIVTDADARKIAAWNSSQLPFYEPGMSEILEDVRVTKNIRFDADVARAVSEADAILVSVSTPLKKSGEGAGYAPDVMHWEKIARLIASTCPSPKIIVERSTVPVKTAEAMARVLSANSGGQDWVVLSNPEFSREGMAMTDHASPERIMIGADDTPAALEAAEAFADVYRQWVPNEKIIVSNLWSAELAKLTANAFLAQRVSSINAISALCERTGADVSEVSYAVGIDSRIGPKGLAASVGFGGTCYETHLRNLVYMCRKYRMQPVAEYWESVISMNEWQKRRFASNIVSAMYNTVSGKRLAVLGFAYKKNTSDTRHSAAIDVCKALLAERAELCVYDPKVGAEAIAVAVTDDSGVETLVSVERSAAVACSGAHAIVVLTEWDEFRSVDYKAIYETMQKPAFVFDGRNLLDHEELRKIGYIVYGVGKPQPTPAEASEAERVLNEQKRAAEANRIAVGAARPPPVDVSPEMVAAGSPLGRQRSPSFGSMS